MVHYWQSVTTGSFAPALRKQRGEGLRGLLAYQGWTVQRLALLLLFEAEGGRGVLVQGAVECTLLASGNSWHFCSKQFVRLLIYHWQSLTTGSFAPSLRQQRGERCEDYWHTKVVSGHYWHFGSSFWKQRREGCEDYWHRKGARTSSALFSSSSSGCELDLPLLIFD
jgi:hypothetical protein